MMLPVRAMRSSKRVRFYLKAIFLFSLTLASVTGSSATVEQVFPVKRIAHAGGSVDGISYLNSIEAMSYNIKRGFRYFELDFSFTKDKKVVCLRDWEDDAVAAFNGPSEGRLSYDGFLKLVSSIGDRAKQRCDQYSLLNWLEHHPNARIITDFKEQNLQGLVFFAQYLPAESVIPQIYFLEDYDVVKELGYTHIIWTLYRSRLDNDGVIKRLLKFYGYVVVAMTKERASSGLANRLKDLGIPFYVHTINDVEELSDLRALGALEVYSDDLYPDIYQ
jgi:glycerophosphoryl diester phosphodiesterase